MSDREFWIRLAQLFFGTTLLGLGARIAVAGVAALTSAFQAVAVAVASAAGYHLVLPDAPAWVGITLLMFGVPTAILGAVFVLRAGLPSDSV
jgi:uncharacterized membrane protein